MAEHGETMNKLFYYDKEQDILSIHKGFSKEEAFHGNIDIGDLILDMSTKSRIRGIELLNASQFLHEFLKNMDLKQVTDADFSVIQKPNSLVITIMFKSEKELLPAKIAVPIRLS